MKILTKDDSNNLVWKDVIYKNKRFYSPDEKLRYDTPTIFSLKDDDRNKTVICSSCGKEIPNTASAIRAHQNMVNKPNKCFECEYLSTTNARVESQKYILNDDGTYTESTKRNVTLTCYRGWRRININSTEVREGCKYARCENANFNHIEDFWTKYPNAFDEFITIDRIIDMGYKGIRKLNNGFEFELKGRGSLIANVNNQGVCYGFSIRYRGYRYMLRYSKKYDKAWIVRDNFEALSTLGLADDTEEAIIKKLRNLYK